MFAHARKPVVLTLLRFRPNPPGSAWPEILRTFAAIEPDLAITLAVRIAEPASTAAKRWSDVRWTGASPRKPGEAPSGYGFNETRSSSI